MNTFRYRISEENYIDMLRYVFRSRECRPMRLLFFAILTVGQMAWVAYMICTAEMSAAVRTFLCVWSVVLAVINILYRVLRPQRARNTFRRLQKTGQIEREYWGEHTLRVDGGEVRLSFGKTKLECFCSEVTLADRGSALLLFARNTTLDIFPYGTTAERDALLQALSGGTAEKASAASDGKLEETADAALHFTLKGEEFLRRQVRIYQGYFVQKTLPKPTTLLKLAATALMIWYAVQRGGAFAAVVVTFIGVAWNVPLIMCITPLTRRYLLSKVPLFGKVVPAETMELSVYRVGSTLIVLWNKERWNCNLRKAELLDENDKGIRIFCGGWPAVFLPTAAFRSGAEQEKFYNSLCSAMRG